jgi:hypothetical protein
MGRGEKRKSEKKRQMDKPNIRFNMYILLLDLAFTGPSADADPLIPNK